MKNGYSLKKDVLLIVLMLIWIIVMVSAVTYTIVTTASAEERRLPVYSVETADKKIALTFNCAWGTEGLDEILEVLKKEDIKCTFFFVGDFAEKYPEAVRRIYNSGHEIGNHSMRHTDPVTQEFSDIVSDINACNELLMTLTGERPSLYRAPSGSYDNKTVEAAQSLGMTAVQWDVDSIDWKNPSPEKIVSRVTGKAANGSIALFHTGKENTVKALPDVIAVLKNRGYSFCSAGELLLSGDTWIDNTGRQHPLSDGNR